MLWRDGAIVPGTTAPLDLTGPQAKAIRALLAVRDPEAPVITDRKGNPEADADLRDVAKVRGWEMYDFRTARKAAKYGASTALVVGAAGAASADADAAHGPRRRSAGHAASCVARIATSTGR